MVWKKVLGILVFLFLLFLFMFYMFMPLESLSFKVNQNDNFSLENISSEMQFYPNMRFSDSNISYSIDDGCNLNKKNDMRWAFEIVQNLTSLSFYEDNNGSINIFCEERAKVENGFFIAGEGGPTKIIQTNNFYVISGGEILLIRDSSCEKPNVAIHELLHVLGFNHSDNSNNIMYPVSKCKQSISEDMISKINELYSYPSLADLALLEASASLNGRFLDINVSFSNEGLKEAENSTMIISLDGKEVKSLGLEALAIGTGQKIDFSNIWVSKIKIKEIKISLESSFEELSKENNEIILSVDE